MNLNNSQIDALCQEAKIRHDKKYNSKTENGKPIPTAAQKALAIRYTKYIRQVPLDILNKIGIYNSDIREDRMINAIVGLKTKAAKENKFDYDGFKRKIIIASIDSSDMTQLKKKLKIDF